MAVEEDPTKKSSSSSSPSTTKDETLDDSYHSSFQCCVCLDLLYKPIVLACGHISCFWCVHKAMHGLRASHCALCRQPYNHFPSICQLLHQLQLKMEPAAYKRRESEVLEEERRLDIFSPQFGDPMISGKVPSEDNSGVPKEIEVSPEDRKSCKSVALKESSLPENGLEDGMRKQISVDDVLCVLCKELLFQPAVLNCGHVFCESCLSGPSIGPLKCPVCQSLHPGELPNVCLDLDHFLEEQFPREYAMRKEKLQFIRAQYQHGESSSSAFQEKKNAEPPYSKVDQQWSEEDLQNVHVGVGCDSCGMYPVVGKRYRCKDCEEAIGFDLCEACYNCSSKLPGRFNQQHTPDHTFELDESHMLSKILMRSLMLEDIQQGLPGNFPEDHDDLDNNNVME